MRRFATLVLIAGLAALAPSAVRADGVDALGESYRATLVGGGVVSEGVGLASRTGGPSSGAITIAGVPTGAQVVRAALYWAVLAGSDPTVELGGQSVLGSEIGRSPDPCWENLHTVDPSKDSRAYRADVTPVVTGNGTYTVSGVGGSGLAGDGTGASLVVVYQDSSAPFQTTIIVNDGSLTGGLPGYHRDVISHTFFSLPTTSPILDARLHVGIGDGQPEFSDGRMMLGTAEMLPPNGIDGSDGPSWDDKTLSVPLSLFGSETTSIDNAIETVNDCIVWVYAAVEMQQEKSAVPPPSVSISSPTNGAVFGTSTVTISGASTGATTIRLSEGQQFLSSTGVDAQGFWSAPVTLSDGPHSITATALDAANTPVASVTVQFSINAGGPPPGPVMITSPGFNSVLSASSVPFMGTATGALSVRLAENNTTLATLPVSGGSWSGPPITFSPGAHFVSATPLDGNGNQSGASTYVQFGVDTSPPTVELSEPEFPSPPGGAVEFVVGNADVHGTASDDLAIARVVVSYRPHGTLDSPTEVEASCGGCTPSFCMHCGNRTVQWSAHLTDLAAPGVYQVSARAYDLAGRSTVTRTRLLVVLFNGDGPGGLFGPDGPLCVGPVEDLLC